MLKFELQAILLIVSALAGGAWLVLNNVISKAREHGLVDKAKKHATSFNFWKNVFAVVGVVFALFFVVNLLSPS